ncbi:hypothetical protein [Methanosarcina horonobensis]|uniref:hypothetical protein n=1 Tax=Methanosarcina horonobensis TaxID=418008 RepID=UPI0022B897A6|nr:hypothetical protein [Methanosarcina horonobensis]
MCVFLEYHFSIRGVELSALQGWESYALSGFWFIITVIGFLLTMVIVLETPKDILE